MSKAIATTASKSEDDWRIESDARTLIQAAEIKLDKARYKKALAVVQTMAKATTAAAAQPEGNSK
jgi:hypothetical protein